LSVENFQGRLGGQWSADHLLWQQDSQSGRAEQGDFAWSPLCLTRMTLCIERLKADQVSLQFPPAPTAARSSCRICNCRWPSSWATCSRQPAVQRQRAAQGPATGGALDREGDADRLGKTAARRSEPEPFRAVATHRRLAAERCRQPDPAVTGHRPWTLALKVDGDLLKTLNLNADSHGYLDGQLSGELQPLAENLPAKVRITADGFKPSADLPDTLQLNQLDLTGEGDLKNGYQLLGKATLPAEKARWRCCCKARSTPVARRSPAST
jgi:translocation and assembly module TamB